MLCISISTLSAADPCSCLWHGSFIHIIDKADLMVSGKITQSKGNAIDFNIDKLFIDKARNGKEFKKSIRIWANNGKQCRPEIDQFSVNSHWLMALYKITEDKPGGFNPNTPNISYGRINDYYLSKCGAYWLELHDGYVVGNLLNGSRWQWQDEKMNPVLLELLENYINGTTSKQALAEAAKPQTAAKKLMDATKSFIKNQ